jgi:tRNA threonylcarbamoyladenosine modification (KEOPS) complex Cgi121 subunit
MWVSSVRDSRFFVAIGGFRGSVAHPKVLVKAIGEAASPHSAQIVDAGHVAGRDHLWMAAVNAARSTETGLAMSKNITVEALLYASAQDQITKAIATLGVSVKTIAVALMVFAPTQVEAEVAYRKAAKLLGVEDDGVLELDAAKAIVLKKSYRISDTELEAAGGEKALSGLIVERGALLSLRR